ncbi:YwlC protein [Phlegmacium glaucopus]|nr:YwlC protein [Phlegmacium glaucopus]
MPLEQTILYRSLLRELRLSISTPRKVNRDIMTHFRSLVESYRGEAHGKAKRNLEDAVLFLKSQREHKRLLERYNPLFDLTAEERIEATARRITSPETTEALKIASHRLLDLAQTVVFPTETVYGLGALALDPQAVSKIFSTKGRPPDNPLIVHVSSTTMLHSLLPPDYVIPQVYQTLMKHFWPGALTLLFPRNPDVVPAIVTANQSTVAIRIPSHPVARALIAVANAPLAAPSANTSGKPSPTRASHVFNDLGGKVSLILDGGPCEVGLESTVVDGLHADGNIRVLRPGGITVEDLERVLLQDTKNGEQISKVLVHKRDYTDNAIESAPTTPGMKYQHYSPSVPVILLLTHSDPRNNHRRVRFLEYAKSLQTNIRLKVGVLAPTESGLWDQLFLVEDIDWHRYPLGPVADPSVIAYRLFDGLLTLEQQGVDLMFIEEVDEEREGLAIMNRVRKAAGESVSVSFN